MDLQTIARKAFYLFLLLLFLLGIGLGARDRDPIIAFIGIMGAFGTALMLISQERV